MWPYASNFLAEAAKSGQNEEPMGPAEALKSDKYPRLAPNDEPTGVVRRAHVADHAAHLRLRLARAESGGPRPHPRVRRAIEAARQRVAEENTRSAGLSPDDIRLLMALRVSDALEGGRAAVLRPERRRELVANAQAMGLRPFDASLIIAIVQDGARRGEHLDAHETTSRLKFVASPTARHHHIRGRRLAFMVMAGTLGAAWAVALISWLLGG